ncbi:hypothetical protein [Spiroplasma endosymbiont of Othius punctulatus]|uniref:hypothetical protein n=1 Tax=Spiroplasma endosymbiont of Othius punctulatus TaxID=3066289 RepID=UPI0030CB5A9D
MFNKFPIFKRTFVTQLSSKINLILLLIFTPTFIAVIISGILLADLVLFGWVAFAVLLLFVTFFNVFFTTNSFNKDLELGVINLEVRSGYKNTKLFFQRYAAQKSFIIPIQIILFLIWTIAGYASGVSYIQMSTTELIFGMLTIFLYEALISSFLLLFSSLKSGIATTFFGVIIGILLAVMPLFSLLESYTSSAVAMNDKSYSKYTLQKYSVLSEFDQIRLDNKDGIIDGQVSINFESDNEIVTSSFFEAFTVFDLFFFEVRGTGPNADVYNVKQNIDRNGRDSYNPAETYINISRSYTNDLIYNGLASELVNPTLELISKKGSGNEGTYLFDEFAAQNPVAKAEYEKLVMENKVLQFIKEIDEIDNSFFGSKKNNVNNSFFSLNAKTNDRFSGSTGFDNFVEYLKNNYSNDSEMLRIIDLVNETAKFSYTSAYKTNSSRSSIFDIGGSTVDNPDKRVEDTNLWLTNPEINNSKQEWTNITSDGARVFFKVYFDILREYMINQAPKYNISNRNSDDSIINGTTYLKEITKRNLINTGTMLTSFFYNSGYNKNFKNSQIDFFNPYITYVYDFDEDVKNKFNIGQYLTLEENPNGVGLNDVLIWDLSDKENAIDDEFIEKFKEKISSNSDDEIEAKDIELNVIELKNTFKGAQLDGLQVYTNKENYFGEKNISILFINGSGVSGGPSDPQKTKITETIKNHITDNPEHSLKDENPTKSDLYKFGKKDGELYYVGSTFNVWIPLIALISITALFFGLSWFLFNKRIIR